MAGPVMMHSPCMHFGAIRLAGTSRPKMFRKNSVAGGAGIILKAYVPPGQNGPAVLSSTTCPTPSMLRNLINWVSDTALNTTGYPIRLSRLLQRHAGELLVQIDPQEKNIANSNVIPWHCLGKDFNYPYRHETGSLQGWRYDGYGYRSFSVYRPEYAKIGECTVINEWSCDITDVHGFAGSKSNLKEFTSIDAMAEARCPDWITDISAENLAQNLSHGEIRIIHAPGVDRFERNLWDDRLFLMNAGGSHHFAAAKYIATRLPKAVPLQGELRVNKLNADAIGALQRDYEMFVIPHDRHNNPHLCMAFFEALEEFRATWLWHPMPRPFEHAQAVLLPRSERRSMRVADLLRQANITDLGQHLQTLLARQSDIATPKILVA